MWQILALRIEELILNNNFPPIFILAFTIVIAAALSFRTCLEILSLIVQYMEYEQYMRNK